MRILQDGLRTFYDLEFFLKSLIANQHHDKRQNENQLKENFKILTFNGRNHQR